MTTLTALLLEARRGRMGRSGRRRPLKTAPRHKTSARREKKSAKPIKITKEMLKKGVKPEGVTWKDWMQAGGKFGGGTGKPRPKKLRVPSHVEVEIGRWALDRVYISDSNLEHHLQRSGRKGDLPHTAAWVGTDKERMKLLLKLGVRHYRKKGRKSKEKEKAKSVSKSMGKALSADPFAGASWGDEDKLQQTGWWGVGGGKKASKRLPKPKPKLTPEQQKLRDLVSGFKKKMSHIPRTAAGGIVFKTFEGPDLWDLPVLACQVAPKYGTYWVFPKGGLDIGESLHKGAAREVKEESGVRAKVANNQAHVTKSKFGDRGKYDLPLILKLMKEQYPKEAKFIESQAEEIKGMFFSWENETHYYVMKHTGGSPGSGTDHEMARSEWVSLRDAFKRSYRMEEVVTKLFPVIRRMWKPTGEAKKPLPISALRTPKPKTMPVGKPSGKPIGPSRIVITPATKQSQKHTPLKQWPPPKKQTSYKSYPIWKLYGGS